MKKYQLIFVFVVLSLSCCLGQNTTTENEQTFALPASQQVDLNLKFANEIKVISWGQNKVGIKTKITSNSDELRKLHTMEVLEGKVLQIETGYDMESRKEKDREYSCWSCNEDREEDCQCLEVSYEVMLPNNAELRLETISGNIEIRGFEGKTWAKSISGFVDLGLPSRANRNLINESATGEIYTDFDVTLDEDSSPWSKKINTSLNGGGDLISLETVSGDIFFRKE